MRSHDAKRQDPVPNDWYYDADPMERREYDAFGPWLGTIRTSEDMPPRFRHAYEGLRSSTFLFKIPVDADRRVMRPGMDLYRAVLAIDPRRVVLLEWDGSTETRRESTIQSIQSIRLDHDLLSGKLSLLLADGQTASLAYNSVSNKEIEQVADFLRERMTAGTPRASHGSANGPSSSASDIKEHFYLGMWEKYARRFPAARILYWESPGISCGRFRSSLGCLLLDVGSELVIISQGQYTRSWFKAVYSGAEQYVPWTALETAERVRRPAGRKSFIPTIRLTVPGHIIDIDVFASTDAPGQLLAELAIRMGQTTSGTPPRIVDPAHGSIPRGSATEVANAQP